jgi:acylphosphatase
MMQAHRYIVRGRVQGVGFRWFVEREANSLGVTGWVRNNEDSTVEVLAMGSPEQLSALRRQLERGPRAARVDTVEVSVVEDAQQMSTFQIQGAW